MKKRQPRVIAWRIEGPQTPPPVGTPVFGAGEPVYEQEPEQQPVDDQYTRNARVQMWRGVRSRLRDGRRLPAPSRTVMEQLMQEIEEAGR